MVTTSGPPRSLRPVWILLALAAGLLLWIWLGSGLIRQLQIMATYALFLLTALLLLLWWTLFSRRTGPARWGPLAAVLLVGLFAATTVRVRGVTGDWLPVVEWRWAAGSDWQGEDLSLTAVLDAEAEAQPVDLGSPAAFPRFLGADGDSKVKGLLLARDWEAEPPRLVWRRPVGAGWSGFAVADGVAYTQEQRGDFEVVVAYDLKSGEELWVHSDRQTYTSNPIAGPGPRATPTLSQDRVFTFGISGLLSALDRRTGELLWQHDVVKEHSAPMPDHGKTSSPLLVDGRVVVGAGGHDGHSLVAYDAESGELAWHAGDDRSGYGSPALATLAGERQILIFNASSVAGHAVDDGRILWQHPWPPDWPNVAPPVVLDEHRALFSTGYGIGSKVLRIDRSESGELDAELVWESPRMKAKFTNLVLHEGYLYGLDDGVLVCLDPETGERMWKRGRYGHGNLLLVGDVLLVQTERGEMVMLDPSPEEHRELTRFAALDGKVWNPFAVVEPYLLVRNDQQAALWELPLRR